MLSLTFSFSRVLFLRGENFELDICQAQMSGAILPGKLSLTFELDIWLKTKMLSLTFGFSRVLFLPAEIFELDLSRILSLTFVQCEMSGAPSREIALGI